MNKVILSGRLTKDPDYRSLEELNVANYSLAVDRKKSKDGEQADFVRCVAYGKSAEFVQNYLKKGMKVLVIGRIKTGAYTDKDGKKVYTTDIVVDEHEFCERKATPAADSDIMSTEGFTPIADDEELPFM